MSSSSATQRSLVISFALLLIVTGSFCYFVSRLSANKGEMSFVPFMSLVSAVFVWQFFALSRNRRSFVLWILAILYALALVPFIMEMIRSPSARQLW
jgi:Ca2+/Na+ antiporter